MVNLVKGQKVNLTKESPSSKRFCVGLGWDIKKKGFFGGDGADYDLDASAFVFKNGKLDKTIYYNNRGSKNDAVYHHGDNLTGAGDGDDEQITVNLDKLDVSIDRIVFTVNIYNAKSRNQNFGKVKNAFIRLVDESTNTEVCRYNLSKGDVDKATALVFAEVYRTGSEWGFNAIGEGSSANNIDELTRELKSRGVV